MRATSPGAEIREAQRAAAARKEAEEKRKRAIQGPPTPQSVSPLPLGDVLASERARIGQEPVSVSVPPSPRPAQSVRRFQISRPSASTPGSRPSSRAGIQKRRADGPSPGIAVLVEQLQRKPHSRQASVIADLVHQASESQESIKIKTPEEEVAPPAKPRKRPVVNQAEKKWREERQAAISAAKDHLSETLEKSARAKQSTWDEESERLAKEFEQVALDIERDMDVEPRNFNNNVAPPSPQPRVPVKPPQPLKYQPRPPKQPRAALSQSSPALDETKTDVVPTVGDDDDDYVYDVYIRRPLEESDRLANPLAELESEQQLKAANSGVGIIVITEEDEQYWENFIEDDEEEWDSEDADSNGRSLPFPMNLIHVTDHAIEQLKTILQMSTRKKSYPHLTRKMILLPSIENIGPAQHQMTKNLILTIPGARVIDSDSGVRVDKYIRTMRVIKDRWIYMYGYIEFMGFFKNS